MTAATHLPPNEDGATVDIGQLQKNFAAAQQEIKSLTEELEETNKGVVALYAELDQQAAQLQQNSELKSRFLSYLSHEFRTPLNSIRSIARILLDHLDGPLTEEQDKQIRFMQNSAIELTEMVNDLLDLAKVEAGRITVSPEWFEMVDLFAALRGMFKPILGNEEVALIFEEAHEAPRLFTDNQKLSQILRNFISNALKFTRAGEVRVSARMSGHDCVTFAVSDTGLGIPDDFLESIFDEYVQVDSLLQKKLRGTGLGLAISRRLAIVLGGDVAVKSQLGVGSTFSVTIPARLDSHTPPCPPEGGDSL